MIEVTIAAEQAGVRLDQIVHDAIPGLSRAAAQRLVDEGRVTLDGAAKTRSTRVQRGQVVAIDQPAAEVVPEEVPTVLEPRIVFEDEHLVVVDKPIGLITHSAPGSPLVAWRAVARKSVPASCTASTRRPPVCSWSRATTRR